MAILTVSRAAAGLFLAASSVLAACAPSATPSGAPAAPAQSQQAAPAPAQPSAQSAAPAPVTRSDFKRPEILIETDKLASLLSDKDLRIIDVRPAAKYQEGHIPGAVNLNSNDLDQKKANEVQDLAAPAKVAEVLGGLGITDNTKVVLYDDQRTLIATRVYWVLDYLSHKDVAVLNGGYPKWEGEKREVTRAVPRIEKAVFTPKPDATKIADSQYIKANMGEKSVVFCDARTAGEYEGTDVRAERGGHIPGAKNVNWEDNIVSAETQILKEAARLKELYEQAGVTPDKEVVTYCQTGVRAAQSYFVLRLLGYDKVRNYDGSWQDWAKDSSLPIEGKKS